MFEACEPSGKCDVDQRSFKAYLARWMAATTKMAPYTAETIMPLLQASAVAAAKQCTGTAGLINNAACGIQWTTGVWDGSTGVGQQMCALEVFQSLLIPQAPGPVTAKTGGKSKGDPSAGTGGDVAPTGIQVGTITTGDKVGAGFLTTLVLVGVLGGAWWMIS
jgi:mannan endo-1,6-alpha-mannosidase